VKGGGSNRGLTDYWGGKNPRAPTVHDFRGHERVHEGTGTRLVGGFGKPVTIFHRLGARKIKEGCAKGVDKTKNPVYRPSMGEGVLCLRPMQKARVTYRGKGRTGGEKRQVALRGIDSLGRGGGFSLCTKCSTEKKGLR